MGAALLFAVENLFEAERRGKGVRLEKVQFEERPGVEREKQSGRCCGAESFGEVSESWGKLDGWMPNRGTNVGYKGRCLGDEMFRKY